MRDWLKIIGGMVVISVIYGVLHDMVTAHVSLPYFTEYHAKVVESESPVVMAVIWGFLATFWVGGIAGLFFAIASQVGSLPKLEPKYVLRIASWWMGVLLVLAMVVLLGAWLLAHQLPVDERKESYERDMRLVVVGTTHAFSYAGAAVSVVLLSGRLIYLRWKLNRNG